MNGSEGYSGQCERRATMNFETMYRDVAVKAASGEETSNESGVTLKEHDYIGLSEVSSAQSSSSDKQSGDGGRGEALDLNESATVLRLGPPAAGPKADVGEAAFAKPAVRGPQRSNPILEEFRKAQAMKAATQQHAGPRDMAAYHEAGQKSGAYPGGYHGSLNAYPGAKNNGVKRGFSETVGMHVSGRGEGLCGDGMDMGVEQPDVKVKVQQQGTVWMSGQNPYNVARRSVVQEGGESSSKVLSNEAKKAVASTSGDHQPTANQTVGWPPVRSFVRNNNPVKPAPPPAATTACPSVQAGKDRSAPAANSKSCFVKIYMDGVPFGRKVDLRTNNRYEKLYSAVEEMFQQFISGHYQSSSSTKSHFVSSSSRKLNFLDGSEYVLIYEDHEGDYMLVGDVPWELFVNTVKRLRIMKGSEDVNLAPKSADAVKSQPAVG